jgi:hypothetical protein
MVKHLLKSLAAFAIALSGLAASGLALADPPTRVARVAYEHGVVSFSPAGDDQWGRAVLNRPLTSGDRLWVDDGARAELQIGGAALRLGEDTSASLLNFDDRLAQLRLEQGELSMHVWRIAPGQAIEVDTPNLAYVIRRPGSYRIDVDANDGWTSVATRDGSADVYGEDASFRMRPGESYRFYDTGLRDYERFAVAPPDDLERWASARDRQWEHSVSARYVPRELIGYQDLDEYGHWRDDPGYGHVWIPAHVQAGWAPYRDGHWSWVEPWGWTWIDDAPWGFACSHYGRWANLSGQWAWVPGPANVQAVYAPALVAFVAGNGFNLAFASGSAPAVAWFPLAPREVYRPAYQVSREYFTRVNTSNTVVNVTNITTVYNTRSETKVVYANQRVPGAVVAMPAQAFVQSRPVPKEVVHVQPQQMASVAPVAAPPVAPVRTSFIGASPAAQHPPQAALQRPVVARTAPPPAPAPVAQRLAALAAHPGQPLPPPAPAAAPAHGTTPSAAPAPAAPVKVVQAPAPSASLPAAPPPPAPGARPGEHRRGPAAAAASSPAPAPGGSHPAAPAAPAASHAAPPAPAAAPVSPANRQQAPASSARPVPATPPAPAAPSPRAAAAPPTSASASSSGPRIESPRARDEAGRRPETPPASAAAPAAPAPAAPTPPRAEPPHPAAPAAREEAPRAAPPARVEAPHPPPAPPRAEPPHPAAPAAREEPPRAAPPARVEAPHPPPAPPRAEPPHPAAPAAREEAPHPPPPRPAPPAAREEPPHAAPRAPAAHPPGPAASRQERASEPHRER